MPDRLRIHSILVAFLAAASFASAGCAQLGTVTDGTSLARGYSNDGHLVDGVRLPREGDGYLVPPLWAKRGNNWGTDELVALVVRAARRVQREAPGPLLYVGDLSPQFGGSAATAYHRSHQTGRDADLIFYALDEQGQPQRVPGGMYRFGDDGWTRRPPRLQFDVVREWLLVRALLEDPGVDVQHLFISAPLRQMLLDHAEELGEPRELVERARLVLQQPVDALPHDDHLHVRIFCPVSDRALGCRDRGPLRWFKKTYKYLSARRLVAELPDPLRDQVLKPFCTLLAATSVARL